MDNMIKKEYAKLTSLERRDIIKSIMIFTMIAIPVDLFFGFICYVTVLKNEYIPQTIMQGVMVLFMMIIPFFFHAIIFILIIDLIFDQKELITGKITDKKYRVLEDFNEYAVFINNKRYILSKAYYDQYKIGDNIRLSRTRFSRIVFEINIPEKKEVPYKIQIGT